MHSHSYAKMNDFTNSMFCYFADLPYGEEDDLEGEDDEDDLEGG